MQLRPGKKPNVFSREAFVAQQTIRRAGDTLWGGTGRCRHVYSQGFIILVGSLAQQFLRTLSKGVGAAAPFTPQAFWLQVRQGNSSRSGLNWALT
jgi:hypothetical protein